MKIFVVDDNDTNLILFTQLAKGLAPDIEATAFADPCEALQACAATMPDMVLVDYMMPSMDGHQFIAGLRALPSARDVPIVMVTAADERQVRHKALDLGATDFIAKPIDPIEVKTRLRNLLTLRRSHLRLQDRNAWLGQEVRKATQALVDREQELILRLSKAAEYRDPETGSHIQRMAHYSAHIARRLGLNAEQCELILHAAPMHDIGKMGIPDGILLKPGRLDEDEFRVMKQHPEIGFSILDGSSSTLIQAAAQIAMYHHEKWDGSGYPNGLAGEDIPLFGRIVAVADVFDALTSARPYKRAWPIEKAVDLIRETTGSHFDPKCSAAFFEDWEAVLSIRDRFSDPDLMEDTPPQAML